MPQVKGRAEERFPIKMRSIPEWGWRGGRSDRKRRFLNAENLSYRSFALAMAAHGRPDSGTILEALE
jgi:hypothetical protein